MIQSNKNSIKLGRNVFQYQRDVFATFNEYIKCQTIAQKVITSILSN